MSRGATAILAALALTATLGLTACGGGSNGGGGDGASGGSGAATPTESKYTAPFSEPPGDDGWEIYTAGAMVDAEAAAWLNPIPDSPEAAVVKFLASHARGDAEWEKAVVADPSDRAQRALDEWREWGLNRFQLQGKKETGPDSYYVKTFFEIAVGDDTDEGEDEFEVVREGDGWRVAVPPA